MCPQPHEGPAEEELTCSALRQVDDPERAERLRHLLSGFNHRCRNSLNGIKMSLYLSNRQWKGAAPPSWVEIEQKYQEMERLFDRLQVIYRPLSMTMVRSPLGQLVDERLPSWRSWFTRSGRTLEIEPPCQEVPGDFDPIHLGHALDAFVGWRADHGSSPGNPRLRWRIDAGFFEVAWIEGNSDQTCGPNHKPETRHIRETTNPSSAFDCLSLPLLARIVAAHGGCQETMRDPAAFRLKLRWPRFQSGELIETVNGPLSASPSP
jgi:hypothetical protein